MTRSPHPSLCPQTSFLLVREDTKAAVLLYLLQNVVRPQDQTVVFVATKHHAEYLTEVSWGSGGWRNHGLSNQLHPAPRVALPREATRGQQ
jgi:superfamily II DNA/RNA helicase